jgi:D-mannonate dehydratase
MSKLSDQVGILSFIGLIFLIFVIMKDSKTIEGYLISLLNGESVEVDNQYTSAAKDMHQYIKDYGKLLKTYQMFQLDHYSYNDVVVDNKKSNIDMEKLKEILYPEGFIFVN